MAKKRFHSEGYYAGYDPRRRLEHEDFMMIHEDRNAMANLPQQVMIKAYPKIHGYTPENLDDTVRGVDEQMDGDNRAKMKHFKPHLY